MFGLIIEVSGLWPTKLDMTKCSACGKGVNICHARDTSLDIVFVYLSSAAEACILLGYLLSHLLYKYDIDDSLY